MQSIILYRPRFVHSSYVRWSVLFVLWRFIQFKAILFKFFEKCIQFTTWCCFIEIFHFNNTSFKASLCKYLEYEKLSLIKIADIEWKSNNILTTTTKKKEVLTRPKLMYAVISYGRYNCFANDHSFVLHSKTVRPV